LTRYPDGQFAAVARIKLAELSKQSAAPVRNDKPEKVAATLPPPADRDASRISATPEMPPGEVKVNRKDGQKYVWAPAGAFQMGCSPGDNGCTPAELPSHKVQITHGFWIGQTEVTVGAFKRYSQSTGRPMPREPIFGKQSVNPGWMKDDLPMVNISWHEAKSYCEWAGMRLPTEAEWEMAARAGNPGARYGFVKQIAWYGDNSGNKAINAREIFHDEQNDYRLRLIENGNSPRPVAQKTPNGYGLYDILGNAAEWVSDWFSESYYQSSPSQDPQGPPTGALRVHRGGAWNRMMRAVRVSARGGDEPDFRGPAVGCRCAGNLP
jgi:formylglycine-generating enzyme required for sulfatase activity